jgi:hypothetical protein
MVTNWKTSTETHKHPHWWGKRYDVSCSLIYVAQKFFKQRDGLLNDVLEETRVHCTSEIVML